MPFVILQRVRDNTTEGCVDTGYDLDHIARVTPHKDMSACWIISPLGQTIGLVAGTVQEIVDALNKAGSGQL